MHGTSDGVVALHIAKQTDSSSDAMPARCGVASPTSRRRPSPVGGGWEAAGGTRCGSQSSVHQVHARSTLRALDFAVLVVVAVVVAVTAIVAVVVVAASGRRTGELLQLLGPTLLSTCSIHRCRLARRLLLFTIDQRP